MGAGRSWLGNCDCRQTAGDGAGATLQISKVKQSAAGTGSAEQLGWRESCWSRRRKPQGWSGELLPSCGGGWSKLQGLGRSWCSGRSPDSPSSRSAERVGRSWWFGEAAAPAVDLVGWRVTNSSRSPKRISDIPWLVWVVPSSLSYLVRVLRQVRFSPRSVFRSTRSRALRMPRAFASPLDDWGPSPTLLFRSQDLYPSSI